MINNMFKQSIFNYEQILLLSENLGNISSDFASVMTGWERIQYQHFSLKLKYYPDYQATESPITI